MIHQGAGHHPACGIAQVQRDFEELPEGAAASLRDSLVELLLRFGNGSPPVRTQLCLAVAALVAHMPPQQWGPGGSLQWLVQRLSSDSQAAALPCLLELLTILPQVHKTSGLICRCAYVGQTCSCSATYEPTAGISINKEGEVGWITIQPCRTH